MKEDTTYSDTSPNIVLIKDNLLKTKTTLKELLSLTLEEIKNNPSSEEELLYLWSSSLKDLSLNFLKEAERTDNSRVYKRVLKLAMFGK